MVRAPSTAGVVGAGAPSRQYTEEAACAWINERARNTPITQKLTHSLPFLLHGTHSRDSEAGSVCARHRKREHSHVH